MITLWWGVLITDGSKKSPYQIGIIYPDRFYRPSCFMEIAEVATIENNLMTFSCRQQFFFTIYDRRHDTQNNILLTRKSHWHIDLMNGLELTVTLLYELNYTYSLSPIGIKISGLRPRVRKKKTGEKPERKLSNLPLWISRWNINLKAYSVVWQ